MSGFSSLPSIARIALFYYDRAVSGYATANLRYNTGWRINSAADDPTGAVRINTLQTQIGSTTAAITNNSEASSLLATALTSLSDIEDTLDTIRAKAVEAMGTLDAETRAEYQAEVEAAVAAIQSIVDTTHYGGTILLDGTYTDQTVQVGTNAGDTTTISINDMNTATLGSDISPGGLGDIDLSTGESAATAVDIIDSAINTVSLEYATQNGAKTYIFDSNVTRLTDINETLTDSLSSIRDISAAEATADLLAAEIRVNAAATSLAHAGLVWQNVQSILMGNSSSASSSTASSLLSLLV